MFDKLENINLTKLELAFSKDVETLKKKLEYFREVSLNRNFSPIFRKENELFSGFRKHVNEFSNYIRKKPLSVHGEPVSGGYATDAYTVASIDSSGKIPIVREQTIVRGRTYADELWKMGQDINFAGSQSGGTFTSAQGKKLGKEDQLLSYSEDQIYKFFLENNKLMEKWSLKFFNFFIPRRFNYTIQDLKTNDLEMLINGKPNSGTGWLYRGRYIKRSELPTYEQDPQWWSQVLSHCWYYYVGLCVSWAYMIPLTIIPTANDFVGGFGMRSASDIEKVEEMDEGSAIREIDHIVRTSEKAYGGSLKTTSTDLPENRTIEEFFADRSDERKGRYFKFHKVTETRDITVNGKNILNTFSNPEGYFWASYSTKMWDEWIDLYGEGRYLKPWSLRSFVDIGVHPSYHSPFVKSFGTGYVVIPLDFGAYIKRPGKDFSAGADMWLGSFCNLMIKGVTTPNVHSGDALTNLFYLIPQMMLLELMPWGKFKFLGDDATFIVPVEKLDETLEMLEHWNIAKIKSTITSNGWYGHKDLGFLFLCDGKQLVVTKGAKDIRTVTSPTLNAKGQSDLSNLRYVTGMTPSWNNMSGQIMYYSHVPPNKSMQNDYVLAQSVLQTSIPLDAGYTTRENRLMEYFRPPKNLWERELKYGFTEHAGGLSE